MPPTKKRVSKKSTGLAKKRKTLASSVMLETDELLMPEKQFINVYDKDPVILAKSKLAWLIVGIIMIIIVSFWFWSLKTSMKNKENDTADLNEITAEINNVISEFKSMVGNTKNAIDQAGSQIDRQAELEKIKNEVLAQIQINSDSANWPEHSSQLLNLSLKYPANWDKQEIKDSLALASYDLKSTTTPEISAKIIITKIKNNSQKTEDLIENKSDYQKSTEEIFIDLVPAEKYNSKATKENALSYLLFVTGAKNIYQIDIYTSDSNIFETTINKILSTIDLL
ncbi:MAG: hypothetical protein Q7K65_05510 [Candidatus Buchananbacteria bacterium]|nr:hypothetical protein [Candidatus Buchananbacteria bacterium]